MEMSREWWPLEREEEGAGLFFFLFGKAMAVNQNLTTSNQGVPKEAGFNCSKFW